MNAHEGEQTALLGEGSEGLAGIARTWIYSQMVSTKSSAERLAGIRNDAVNQDAHGTVVRRMQQEVEMLRFIYETLCRVHPSEPSPTGENR